MRGPSQAAALVLFTAVLTLPAGASASASSRDVAATHAYLAADYAVLHATVSKWSAVEANIAKLDAKYSGECFHAGAGSPQSEEEQKLSLEVAGALWSAGYRTNASAVRRFVASVGRLSWSKRAITRSARALIDGLRAMITLPAPNLCADVRAWAAGGFQAMPADVERYAKHVEAIEIDQIPRRLLAPYLSGGDVALAARDERLNRRFEELEFVHGQDRWNGLLEVLALNQ